MIEELDIPEDLKPIVKRVMRRLPAELKGDLEFLKNLLIYIKIGGEKLARQRIAVTKKPFRDGYLLLNRLIPEESLQDISNETSEENENEDESPAQTSDETTDKPLNKNEDDES